jgi:hypothetical protein
VPYRRFRWHDFSRLIHEMSLVGPLRLHRIFVLCNISSVIRGAPVVMPM